MPMKQLTPHEPGHADGQRDLIPGERAQLPQLIEMAGDVHIDSPAGAAQHGAGRDSHRGAVSVVVGQRVGDLARSLPTEVRRADVAVGGPCAGAHVPAVRGSVVASGLQVLGDQRGILVGRFRAA